MSLYSDFPARRARQIIADIVAILAIIGSVIVGVTVHGVISAFAAVGVQIEQAGTGFQDTMIELGDNLGSVPLIGSSIRGPFDAASGSGGALVDAGVAVQNLINQGALAIGLLVAIGPILAVLAIWLLPRLLFVRRAAEARALARSSDGAELLALRALTNRPARELATVHDRPLDAWRRGDVGAVRALAQLELRRAGVKL